MKKKISEEKILEKIKKLYQNYGIDILVMEEDEFKRIVEFYKSNVEKLAEDLKKIWCTIHLFQFYIVL